MASMTHPLFTSLLISAFSALVWTQTTSGSLGCTQNRKFYRPGQEIFRSRVGDWCYGTTCSPKGQIVRWDDFSCGPPSSGAQPMSCVVNGQVYQPGEDISESRAGTWCYGKFCDLNGHLVSWNNYDCAQDVTTTLPPTTSTIKKSVGLAEATDSVIIEETLVVTDPTIATVCVYNGVTYRLGQQIPGSDDCGFQCGVGGQVVRNPCVRTTTTPPPTTISPPTTIRTCLYNGVTYQPGQQIPDGMGCGFDCSVNGELLRWPCTTPPQPTTLSPTCLYNGVTYQPGQQIPDGNGCGFECGPDGLLLPYPCTRRTTPPVRPTTAPQPSLTCTYNGVTYQPGQQIWRDASGCGYECGPNGELLAYPCQPPTTVPITTRLPSCFYNGQFYSPGQRIPGTGQHCGGLCSEQGEVLLATCVSPPTTLPTPPVTCSYNGVTYSPGQQIPDGNGCGFECSTNGELLPYPCPPPTTTPRITVPSGCFHEGRLYGPGESFGEGRSGNWCYGMYCSENGEIVAWDNFNCGESTPTTVPVTTYRTTSPVTCSYKGVTYSPGQQIPDGNGCGFECSTNGELLPHPCPPPTTTPRITVPSGCFHEGRLYGPGESFGEGRSGNWCYGMYCSENGEIVAWDNFNCGQSTPTATPITTYRTTLRGCFYNGTTYAPGSPIHRDSAGCGRFCNIQGQIDYYLCTRATTPPTAIPNGCFHEGKLYKPGDSFGEGREGNWCYGMICGENGEIAHWDNFQCGGSTTAAPPNTTTSPGQQRGCTVGGKFYKSGEEITRVSSLNMCYGTLCDENGDVIAWEDFTCGDTGSTVNPQEPVKDCQYQGQAYKPGQKILLADSRGCKVYCSLEGRVRVERFPCITPVTNASTETPDDSTYRAYICGSQIEANVNGSRLVICSGGYSLTTATSFLNIGILLFAYFVIVFIGISL